MEEGEILEEGAPDGRGQGGARVDPRIAKWNIGGSDYRIPKLGPWWVAVRDSMVNITAG